MLFVMTCGLCSFELVAFGSAETHNLLPAIASKPAGLRKLICTVPEKSTPVTVIHAALAQQRALESFKISVSSSPSVHIIDKAHALAPLALPALESLSLEIADDSLFNAMLPSQPDSPSLCAHLRFLELDQQVALSSLNVALACIPSLTELKLGDINLANWSLTREYGNILRFVCWSRGKAKALLSFARFFPKLQELNMPYLLYTFSLDHDDVISVLKEFQLPCLRKFSCSSSDLRKLKLDTLNVLRIACPRLMSPSPTASTSPKSSLRVVQLCMSSQRARAIDPPRGPACFSECVVLTKRSFTRTFRQTFESRNRTRVKERFFVKRVFMQI